MMKHWQSGAKTNNNRLHTERILYVMVYCSNEVLFCEP